MVSGEQGFAGHGFLPAGDFLADAVEFGLRQVDEPAVRRGELVGDATVQADRTPGQCRVQWLGRVCEHEGAVGPVDADVRVCTDRLTGLHMDLDPPPCAMRAEADRVLSGDGDDAVRLVDLAEYGVPTAVIPADECERVVMP